jgi:hypothetical protein
LAAAKAGAEAKAVPSASAAMPIMIFECICVVPRFCRCVAEGRA